MARSLALSPAVRAAPSIEAGRCEMTLGTFSASSVRRAPVRCGPPCPPRSAAAASPSRAPAHAPRSAVAVLPERIRRSEKRRRDRMRNATALTSTSSRLFVSAQPTRPRPSAAAGRCSSQANAGASARGEGARGEGARGEGARGDQGERRGAVTLRRADTEGSSRARRGGRPWRREATESRPMCCRSMLEGCRGISSFIRAGFDTTRGGDQPELEIRPKCPNWGTHLTQARGHTHTRCGPTAGPKPSRPHIRSARHAS